MRAIEYTKLKYIKYPNMTSEVIIINNCPNHIITEDNKPLIDMNLSDCLSFENCNDCWEQEV